MTDEKSRKKLTNKQRVFIEAYLKTWSGAEAARQAGYKHPDRLAYVLLRKVEIQDAIQKRMEELAMSADEVISRLSEQASMSLADFLLFEENDGRQVLAGINWDKVRERGHLVKSIVPGQWGIKLELHDGQTALIAMAKRHQLLSDKTEHHVDVVEMTLDEWKEEQKRRQEETGKVLEEFD